MNRARIPGVNVEMNVTRKYFPEYGGSKGFDTKHKRKQSSFGDLSVPKDSTCWDEGKVCFTVYFFVEAWKSQ